MHVQHYLAETAIKLKKLGVIQKESRSVEGFCVDESGTKTHKVKNLIVLSLFKYFIAPIEILGQT